MVWDATSPDTFAPSYLQSVTSAAGAVAALAENRKKEKYGCLDSAYSFTPTAIESSGAFGSLTQLFLRDLGNHLKLTIGEEKSFSYLLALHHSHGKARHLNNHFNVDLIQKCLPRANLPQIDQPFCPLLPQGNTILSV